MVPQDHGETHHCTRNSIVEDEVMDGLMAAKIYERNRPRLSLAVQEEMIQNNFPRLPDGESINQLTEDECMELRMSIQDMASQKMTHSIANLREQLTEYHSLIDRLSSITAKYEALKGECQERGNRIESLEQEVTALKKVQRTAGLRGNDDSVRCISCTDYTEAPGGRGASQPFSRQFPIQLQETPNYSTFFQPNVSSSKQDQAPGHFCDMNYSPIEHQARSPFCGMNQYHIPSDGGVRTTNYLPPGDCNRYRHVSELSLSAPRPKRAKTDAYEAVFSGLTNHLKGTFKSM